MTDSARVDASEVANLLVLAVAGLIIGWSNYQGTLWTNERIAQTNKAGALAGESGRLAARADTLQAVEVGLFGAWLEANIAGDKRRMDAYVTRFPPNLHRAFDAWIVRKHSPAAPSTPFTLAEYNPPERAQSAELSRRAASVSAKVDQAMRVTDGYAQSESILSIALFFAGVGQVFRARSVRWTLVALAVLACALGVWRMLSLPAITLLAGGG
jgi:hypothetical protein